MTELFYLLGYVLYLHPERMTSSVVYQEAEKSFLSALEVGNDYPMAWLYLGHNSYDKEDYFEAQKRFLVIREDSLDPFWNLKLLEIKLCRSIKIKGLDSSPDQLEIFIEEAEKLPVEDIYPLSLDQAIKESVTSLAPSNKLRLMSLLEKLDKSARWGSYKHVFKTDL